MKKYRLFTANVHPVTSQVNNFEKMKGRHPNLDDAP